MEFEGERLKVFACPLGGVGSGNLEFFGDGAIGGVANRQQLQLRRSRR